MGLLRTAKVKKSYPNGGNSPTTAKAVVSSSAFEDPPLLLVHSAIPQTLNLQMAGRRSPRSSNRDPPSASAKDARLNRAILPIEMNGLPHRRVALTM